MMKQCLTLFCLFFVGYLSAQTNSNWIQSNTANVSDEKIRYMISVDSTTLFTIENHKILRSTDAGVNWSVAHSDSTLYFGKVFLNGDSLYVHAVDTFGPNVSVNKFWLVAHKDSLQFFNRPSRVNDTSSLFSFTIHNDSIWNIDGSDLYVWKGNSQKRKALEGIESFNTNGQYMSAVNRNNFFYSNDYGVNWDTIAVTSNMFYANLIRTHYFGSDTLYSIGRAFPGFDYYSTDKGQSWTDLRLNSNGSRKPELTYHFSVEGYIAGNYNGVFLLSTDKGFTFSHDTVIPYPQSSMKEYFTHLHIDGSVFLYGGNASQGEIWKNSNPLAVGLSEQKSKNIDFEVYPNPTKDDLSIEVSSDKKIERLEVYSISGQLIQSILIQKKSEKIRLNDLSSGTYMIHLISQNERISKKVIVE